VACIITSLDIHVVDTTSLNICSQIELLPLTFIKAREKYMGSISRDSLRELMYNSSRENVKKCDDDNHT
jgi:hypothetical protein